MWRSHRSPLATLAVALWGIAAVTFEGFKFQPAGVPLALLLLLPLMVAAGAHAPALAPQSLRLVPILHPRQFHRQRAAAAAAGLDTVVPPGIAPADVQTSMLEQALGGIGVRT